MPTYSVSTRDIDARGSRVRRFQELIARLNAAGDGGVDGDGDVDAGEGDGEVDGGDGVDAGDGDGGDGVIDVGDGDADYHIELTADGAYLTCAALPKFSPHYVGFTRARRSSRADPLRRALGGARTVIDATAGWGVDAARMAIWGHRVTAVEQHPLIAALLQHAHAQCDDADLRARLTVIHADSVDYLRAIADASVAATVATGATVDESTVMAAPDAIYLDPMYPSPVKSAAAKKPLTILRRLAGRPGDAQELFNAAITRARGRVVIKRPPRAAPLMPGKVGQTTGKLARFDIYKPAAA